jgi:trigger factor
MQITIEDVSPVEKRVDFELPWPDVASKLDEAYNQLRREVHIKGFRPGKVPRSLIEKMYRQQVEHDVARELIELSIGRAIDEKQIAPVAPPTVDKMELKSGEPFRFSAKVEVRSHVTPREYTGIELERRPPKVTDEAVASALEDYRRQLTQFMPIQGRTTSGDRDLLAVEVHGKVGASRIKKDTVVVDLADDDAGGVPGLAPRLRGIPLDTKQLEIKYKIPEDAKVPALRGSEVDLRVTVKEARERKEPALDDELAKDTGEADTLEDLKTKIRGRLLEADKAKIKRELHAALVKEIIRRNPFPVAPALVDRHARAMVARARAQLAYMGIDIGEAGLDEEKLQGEFAAEAEEAARAAILLSAIAEREGVEVTDADVQKRVAELAAARQENVKKVRAELEKSGGVHGVRAQIAEEKVLDKLLAEAKISDVNPDSLIVTPGRTGSRIVLTPDEAREEARAHTTQKK